MRRGILVVAAALATCLVGCSSSDSLSVEISVVWAWQTMPFSASGGAVDGGVVCKRGLMEIDHFESVEGDVITADETGSIFNNTSFADDEVAEWTTVLDFVCDDGSGTFTMRWHTVITSALVGSDTPQEAGAWEIEGGTGTYGALAGSGHTTNNFFTNDTVYSGELQTG